jgi:hypothetical protein
MVRPAIAHYRWTGYGIDVRVFLHEQGPVFFAADICRALDITVPTSYDHLAGRVKHDWPPSRYIEHVDVKDADGHPVAMYGPDEVRRLATANPEYFTPHFLSWFDDLTAQLSGDDLARAIDNTIGAEPGLLEGENHSVAKCARILSADPTLSYSRQSLFEALNTRLGWTTRVGDIWVPTDQALKAGYLVRQPALIGPMRTLYPQIRITNSGLEKLHALLGGTAALNLTPPAPLTLVELE